MSNVLKKSSGLLFSFIFISCSNPLAGPDLSIYDTSSDEYYVTDLTDFSDGKDLEVICFEFAENNNIDACYDFALVEDLYVGDPMPSAVPVAFIDNEDNEYLKGSHFLTARLNNFRFNGIPLLWAIPLVLVYGLYKLITSRNDASKTVENNNSIHYTDVDPFAKPEEE